MIQLLNIDYPLNIDIGSLKRIMVNKFIKNDNNAAYSGPRGSHVLLMTGLLLAALIMMPVFMPVFARAADKSEILISKDGVEDQKFRPGENAGPDSEELFADYLDQEIYSAAGKEDKKDVPNPSGESDGRIKAKKNTGSRLTGNDKRIYQVLMKYIAETAAGKRASTRYEIGVDDLGIKNKYFTAEDLGVSRLTYQKNGTLTIAPEAEKALLGDLSRILTALLVDCPYELYWYDKTATTNSYNPDIYLGVKDGSPALRIGSAMTFTFPVAKEYAQDGEIYKVDTQAGQKVQSSSANAARIVADCKGLSDYDKLDAYRKKICSLVSYHQEAYQDNWDYGNPWQLIWVFDEDPDTNVVCEGYAKAFQYLCDLSEFDRDITCITVNGTFYADGDSELHMWNVVDMDDETNDEARYLVDLTNCDEGTIGEDQWLFLAAAEEGSVNDGYYFDCDGQGITYCYDPEKIMAYYSKSELQIHTGEAYNPRIAIQRRRSLALAGISGLGTFTRTGKAICPAMKVTWNGKTLDPAQDYIVVYKNNTNVGTAEVTITGKGLYKGAVTKNYRIVPRNVKKFKVKGKKKAILVKWTRQKDQVTGYQVQYSLKSNFKGAKAKRVKQNKTKSLTIGKLKSKKKYYIRIRTYKKIGTAYYYSPWSKKRSIKTR